MNGSLKRKSQRTFSSLAKHNAYPVGAYWIAGLLQRLVCNTRVHARAVRNVTYLCLRSVTVSSPFVHFFYHDVYRAKLEMAQANEARKQELDDRERKLHSEIALVAQQQLLHERMVVDLSDAKAECDKLQSEMHDTCSRLGSAMTEKDMITAKLEAMNDYDGKVCLFTLAHVVVETLVTMYSVSTAMAHSSATKVCNIFVVLIFVHYFTTLSFFTFIFFF